MKTEKAAQQLYICNKLLHGTLHVFILIGFSCTSQWLIQGMSSILRVGIDIRYQVQMAVAMIRNCGRSTLKIYNRLAKSKKRGCEE